MPSTYGEKPARPTAPKPVFTRKDSLGRDQYIAQFAFDGEQSGDLSFKKGDIIEVTKSSGSRDVCFSKKKLIPGLVDRQDRRQNGDIPSKLLGGKVGSGYMIGPDFELICAMVYIRSSFFWILYSMACYSIPI
jgi:hypothetical protein